MGVDDLLALMLLKQKVEKPPNVQKMYALLIPMKFAELHEIVEKVFTAEDILEKETFDENIVSNEVIDNEKV